ncbi:DNA polymerase I [Candidatus Thiomargarita nelsonii]|uniref:DNA polymerase I n=1 Tax=Candidatus Thiomargarita nelsonii TaxID=1003181 RepID=A0A4E0QSG6_9GAMM|nr:DNA polymerase I [Candidatus Thiomargarita nelsonii]
MTNKNTLILIDGSSYFYRAFHGVPSFINSQGMPTGAIYGMTNMLKSLLQDYQPTHTAIVFDAKGKTFRHELFSEYKANRPPMPDELVAQISLTHEIVQALGFPLIMEKGVEADDVIGTLTKQAQAAGMDTLIFTGDKDFAQLVNDSVTLIDTLKKTRLDVQGVIDKFGIPPELIVDYLSLMGDTVDNVPGVKKVGPKTAVKWLKTYGKLDAVIENAAQFKGKIGENLRDALSEFPLTRQLLTIKCDVPLSHTPQQLKLNAPDVNKLQQLYLELEFKQWLTKTPPKPKPKQYHTILTQNDFDKWLKRLNDASLFAFDTETTSLDYLQAQIVGVSFAVQAGEAAYIPLTHDYLGVPQQLSRDEVLAALKPLLENKPKIGQNLKYDAHVLANHGINLQNIAFDTLLESYILDSTATRHDLDSLALKYLKLETIHFEDIAGKGKKQLPFNQIYIEHAAPYAAEDADVALQLHEKLWPQLQSIPKLCQIFTEMEMPLLPVLMRMERNGVKIDAALLQQHSAELAQSLQALEKQAYSLADTEFNLNSPKQLQSILFDKLGLPVLKKTPKKEPSTAVDVLEELASDYPLPKLILEYRSLSKLKSTYTDALPQQINPKTGRVHTSYQQAVTATGRLSSTNPNLQNIPIRTASGRRIRQAFIAEDGYQLIAADYSQIELRIMAHLSQDEKLLSAFAAGEDIHKATAAEVFDVQEVTSEQRRSAKAVNFGLIYGMQAFGLAKQLGIERREAQIYIDTYFARYPGVKAYMEETRELAQKQGYVETIFGRRLYIPDIKSRSRQRQQHAERTAINMPLQGTCADILKKSLLLIDNWIQSSGLDVKIILQVHDELVLETKASILEEVSQKVSELMKESALPIEVPVNIGIGNNWDEAH